MVRSTSLEKVEKHLDNDTKYCKKVKETYFHTILLLCYIRFTGQIIKPPTMSVCVMTIVYLKKEVDKNTTFKGFYLE